MILFSVLRTVLKFLFSLVRKYFWFRVIVESCPDTLKTDSSRADVCSGELPCLEGRLTLDSFSTCKVMDQRWGPGRVEDQTNRNLEVHHLVREGAHLIVEAELVFSDLVRSEDEIALPFLLSVQDALASGPSDFVIDIEGAARLHLIGNCEPESHGKAKGHRLHTAK